MTDDSAQKTDKISRVMKLILRINIVTGACTIVCRSDSRDRNLRHEAAVGDRLEAVRRARGACRRRKSSPRSSQRSPLLCQTCRAVVEIVVRQASVNK